MSYSQKLLACATAVRSVLPDPQRPGRVLSAVDKIEKADVLDPALMKLRQAVKSLPIGEDLRDVMHGRWLGHPVHPLLVQVPVGTWVSAAVLDLVPGKRYTAGLLVGTGLVAALPAAVTGWVDWAEMRKPQMRVGVVHAAANSVAVGCYAASLFSRLRGRSIRGRAWGYAGLAAVGVGGALGGHLAYRQAAAVNHAEDISVRTEPGWHSLGAASDLPVGEAVRRHVGDVPVAVVRESGGAVHVLADRCSHMAGPLSEGKVSDGCVTCPWHGSVFRLTDGWNVSGPATSPQPAFETRNVDGRVEARLNQ
ncbi:Ferredoxin subunit of nitrite reductase or a ring-hydroxylating dioxygenase [Streptomyces sp. WMMB 714]|jgi:nitrite reductase/ring-hydroxylating ferredoxin subunit|uniref:Rieske (2Fe-2S) protein n=1 Tax=Streptomyces sp. WMMB 714 TaxID=1286822 RepID=UPI0005F7C914|nr:Rieske (2Fe-2S) protein [Streptomyces sp. WMMB 714]SCK25877.1 Ferredoxin subunit of nitrite reductase or a ring-hydroxylating dioxygenase [Streptomyces sp. WMMB 714]